ncbi:MAG TPA: exodeoxyribonuclease VII large subunit [Vicinamibacterales bacterium]|jgi:exodeoxyribonuclease VII large subunit|nr:exodeoxyribonuclease VII large subunit [Vicinamibacterales bacterium]
MTSLFDLPFEEPEAEPLLPAPPPDPAPAAAAVLTVSQLTADIRHVLEREFARVAVEGEISNCRPWTTGHVYFTLKDSGAQIRAVMFRSAARLLKFRLEDGQSVIARGRLSLYDVKGEYQLVVDRLEPKGAGALQVAFEQLKRRLEAEGLFAAARKRPLPVLPRKIGVVTSLDGAAVRDIVTVLRARYANAHLVIRPARVQGEGAAADVARGLRAIARVPGVDVVIVGRGGGSIEDLWAFNEEIVARAIAACPIPVISAVGHETDVTIADFVADLRAPTPSAAANLVVARKDEVCTRIDRQRERLAGAMRGRLLRHRARIHAATARPGFAGWPGRVAMRSRHVAELFQDLQRAARTRLAGVERRLDGLHGRLEARDLRRRLGATRARLVTATGRLDAVIVRRRHAARTRLGALAAGLGSLSPLAVLGRGYAVCWDEARRTILRDAGEVTEGTPIRVTLARGELAARVTGRTEEG